MTCQAFLLNRVQNIVVPPRHPLAYHNNHRLRRFNGTRGGISFITSLLFPVDLSSTFSRFTFRIPSIYLLGKTLLLWTVVLLQAADRYPTSDWSWVQRVGQWASGKNMEEICWFTFTSVCVTLFVGALTSGLEGLNSANQTPFNLVGCSSGLVLIHAFTSITVRIFVYSISVHFTRYARQETSRQRKLEARQTSCCNDDSTSCPSSSPLFLQGSIASHLISRPL